MVFGLDGVEVGLIIVFLCLFGGIMSGFPVAFAIGGSAAISFGILAGLDSAGILTHEAIDQGSSAFRSLVDSGVGRNDISLFRYPDLPTVTKPLFEGGWEKAMDRNLSFIVNRMNERVLAGQSIETLLAVAMFVLMGITLERSKIANDLLTTMARVFGPLPGGLAVSVVVVGAFLAASTGIVGATVVTMGLLSLPTMLRNGYSPELSTGVIAASGTLGQIIPPSIVIVLLGTLAGDLYSTAQEERAQSVGCTDALTYLGEPAVLSVGTLFQSALLPGVMLAGLYALYAFCYALYRPHNAPPVTFADDRDKENVSGRHMAIWLLLVPLGLIAFLVSMTFVNVVGSQDTSVSRFVEQAEQTDLRTNVSDECRGAMIDLHGQERWDASVTIQERISAASNEADPNATVTEEEMAVMQAERVANAPWLSGGHATIVLLFALVFALAYGLYPNLSVTPLALGTLGLWLAIVLDAWVISPLTSPGVATVLLAIPYVLVLYGARIAVQRLGQNDLLRVVFPPLILIVAVLGSILGGITNPTPAAALGAGGAIMLAAYRKLQETGGSGKPILIASFAMVIMLLLGINFDLRLNTEVVGFERWVAGLTALLAYHIAFGGLLYACWVLFSNGVLKPVVRETAKVTSMVFTILIGSQLLNLVVISFGGEHYIQQFLRSFDQEWLVLLIVMLVLFILGFVLDFLEIIYIVIPIVGPVIYGGEFDPKWVTILIAVNLQTSFLTPPFGFALFYLRGVAPPSVTTRHIYRGIIPFVIIQVIGLALLWYFPSIVTIVPSLMPTG